MIITVVQIAIPLEWHGWQPYTTVYSGGGRRAQALGKTGMIAQTQ